VSLTGGQQLALRQLQEIQAFGPRDFEIVSVAEPQTDGAYLVVQISVNCVGMPRAEGGLPLRPRERIELRVPPDFPFQPPAFWATHKRFAGFPHVQWMRYLCLYRSVETEWIASDGMYGAIGRLDMWLRHGALNELDLSGEPLHPPAIYPTSDQIIIPLADTPPIQGAPWFGYAVLDRGSEKRVHIVDWLGFDETIPEGEVAAALLLHEPLPFEYPSTVKSLVSELTNHGIPQSMLFALLKLAALMSAEDKPIFLVIGAPMRGIAGADRLEQHLGVWCLESIAAKGFRLTATKFPEINAEAEAIMLDWAETAKVHWCTVHEQRPAVTVRRDQGSPMSWFAGKSVRLWGCGALGSHVGEILARAGVAKIALQDRGSVTPGILARQLFDDADIASTKATALGERLHRINPQLEITTDSTNLISTTLSSEDWAGGADVVIDTTASRTVALKLECLRQQSNTPLVSLAVGHRADRGIVLVSQSDFAGGLFDLDRRAKIAACNNSDALPFREEFWPEPGTQALFEPEPGCSHPTFVGSAADIAALAGSMLNVAALRLADLDPGAASAQFVELPHLVRKNRPVPRMAVTWGQDQLVDDPRHGYQVRIAPPALRQIRGWISRNDRIKGHDIETGGLLYGEFNEPAKIVWVTEVSGPPPDSDATAQGFVCGTEGTQEDNAERKARTKGSVAFIGMWHTHPVSRPMPSVTDLAAMFEVLIANINRPRHTLMLIVGNAATDPELGAYVFSRHDFVLVQRRREVHMNVDQ